MNKADIYKTMGADGMHPWVLREMADIILRPLLIIFEWLWLFCLNNKIPLQGLEESKYHSYLQKGQEGRPGELQAGQSHLNPWYHGLNPAGN